MRTQNGAASYQRYHQVGPKQAFLRHAYQQGCALQAKGQHRDAAKSFAAAVSAAPDFADALQNLGFSLFALGEFAEAGEACAKLILLRPDDAGSHFNLGMALLSDDRAAEAIPVLQNAVRLDGSLSKHHHALSRALAAENRKHEAAAALIRASELAPDDTGLLVTISALLIDAGEMDAAAGAALTAIQQQPGNAIAQGNLARALQSLGKSHEALAPARAAVRLAPLNGGAAATLGAILYTLGHHAEALDRSRQASLLAPTLYQAKMNEGLALEALGRLEEAETAARAALVLAPDAPDVRHNLAAMLLASGRMDAETWALYDSRLQLNPAARRLADKPRWQGEDIAGKTVLLHCEQGFGDTIQFLRYAKLVTARGARVILAVQPELLSLLQDLPGVDAVIPANVAMPDYDVFCPLLSLPRAFGTTLETIPSGAPYLAPPAALARKWAMPPSTDLKVGLVWAGSTIFVHDSARSVGLEALAPLAGLEGIAFHSLQKPVRPIGDFPMLDRMGEAKDFADTAAIIAGLDLVISVDSAVAHLAAAMGKEVWLLSRFVGCWRWLRERDDSPWYPTLRIFHQTAPNDWDGVVARIRDELVRRTKGDAALPATVATARPIAVADRAAVAHTRPSALDGLNLPNDMPRAVAVIIGENENGALLNVAQDFMGLLPPHGLDSHVIDLNSPNWSETLGMLIDRGLLFVWGPAGVGARTKHRDGLLWDSVRVPFISVLADSPCFLPANHHVPSRYVVNGYMFRDWLDMQRRLIRSPQLSSLLPHGVAANPNRDRIAWSQRQHRMVLVKTGCAPDQHRADWATLPPRLRAVVEDAAAAALQRGVGDVSGVVLESFAHHGIYVETRPDLLFGLMYKVDVYVRDVRSTAMVRGLLDLPVDIIGRGWDHLTGSGRQARFHAPVDASALPGLYADTQFLLNTMPNFSSGTHERVVNGFASKCCVVTNENADMAARFGPLPSYFGVDTEAPDLADRLAALYHGETQYDDRLDEAAALAETEYGADGFMRSLIDLALEVRAAATFASFGF